MSSPLHITLNTCDLEAAIICLEVFTRLLVQQHCPHEHTAYQGSFHFTAGDVWDDIVEVCTDCGARLEG